MSLSQRRKDVKKTKKWSEALVGVLSDLGVLSEWNERAREKLYVTTRSLCHSVPCWSVRSLKRKGEISLVSAGLSDYACM